MRSPGCAVDRARAAAGACPSSVRSSVVLPEPEGPTIPVNWSAWTWKVTSRRTGVLVVADA